MLKKLSPIGAGLAIGAAFLELYKACSNVANPLCGVLSEGSAGAMALRGEFNRLSDAMAAWDAKLTQGLEVRLASDRASVAQTLDRFLGAKGEVAATLEGLRRQLADPGSTTSIPGSVATELERRCASLESRVANSLDCARPESGLAVFLRQLRCAHH
jgi:hypothetical protein